MCDVNLEKVFDDYRAISDSVLQFDKPKKEEFIKLFRKALDKKENGAFWLPLVTSLTLCVKCGTCAEVCPVYLASGKNTLYHPVLRSNMLRNIYDKYFKNFGKISTKFTEDTISESDINAMAESIYRCSICRKCAYVCPVGVDNGLLVREMRKILFDLDVVPEEIYDEGTIYQKSYGASTKLSEKAFLNILDMVKDEIEEERGFRTEIPVNKIGADYLVINNAGDYTAFLDTIIAQVVVLNKAKIDWTYNTPFNNGTNDAVNYGLFFSDKELLEVGKLHTEVIKRLRPKTVVVGECGHAFETFKYFYKDLFVEWKSIKVISILELLNDLIEKGMINIELGKNNEAVTYHDSCKIGRLGGIFDEPRNILNKVCANFIEMTPNRGLSICCGGGGGFANIHKSDFLKFRVNTYGKLKLEQVMKTGVSKVALACANCKAQFRDLINFHKLDMEFVGITELVANALL